MTPRSKLPRLAAACLTLPHELAHALPAAAAGLSPELTLLPEYDGDVTPLGQFDAAIEAGTPAWLVRLVAVAPLPTYVGLAVLLRFVVAPSGVAAPVAVLACAYSASLSRGDLAVATRPEQAVSAGRFAASGSRRLQVTADLLTVGTTVLVGVVLLG